MKKIMIRPVAEAITRVRKSTQMSDSNGLPIAKIPIPIDYALKKNFDMFVKELKYMEDYEKEQYALIPGFNEYVVMEKELADEYPETFAKIMSGYQFDPLNLEDEANVEYNKFAEKHKKLVDDHKELHEGLAKVRQEVYNIFMNEDAKVMDFSAHESLFMNSIGDIASSDMDLILLINQKDEPVAE